MSLINRLRRGLSAGAEPAAGLAQPIETGTVAWLRSLDEALSEAQRSDKPVFALFQEVPGCAGCQQFGADVLSDPRIVDAIEHEFVPLLIHNNSPGTDTEVLAAYGEPAWNFQVVRFLGPDGVDLIERKDRVWDTGPLAARMITTLEIHGRPVPAFLRLTEQEHSDRLLVTYLAQACFWVGEMELGQIDGVVTTEAGFIDGHEVTRVTFDPEVLSSAELVTNAQHRGVASQVFIDEGRNPTFDRAFRVAPDSDQKRQLGRTTPTGLSLAQLTKLNAFVRNPDMGASYLAPSQR